MASKRDAVSAAQRVLVTEHPRLRIDGIWGVRTDGAFVKSASTTQTQVVQTLDSFGFKLSDVRVHSSSGGNWIPEAEARSHAEKAARLVGVDPSYMYFLLELEPARRNGPGGREFDTSRSSPNGLYKGLFQVGELAWEDATPVANSVGVSLGSFSSGWRDPFKNAVAAAAFAVRNTGYARDKKYMAPLTNEVLYAMHNQGHTFISSARAGGKGRFFDGQSDHAKRVLAEAADHVRSTQRT